MPASNSGEIATVVSGLPRSGTSLMMQMLGAGGLPLLCDGGRAPDADNPRGYFEYEPVRATARDASWVARAPGRAVKVIHALLPWLPPGREYRILLMRRALREVMASQRAMLERRGCAVDAGDEECLADAFRAQLVAARDWARATPGASLLEVDHAALLADPARAASAVDAFLGRGLDTAAMAACVEPALHRQRVI